MGAKFEFEQKESMKYQIVLITLSPDKKQAEIYIKYKNTQNGKKEKREDHRCIWSGSQG